MLYMVEVVAFDATGDETAVRRRQRHRIEANGVTDAINAFAEQNRSRVIALTQSDENHAAGLLEAIDGRRSTYRVVAFLL